MADFLASVNKTLIEEGGLVDNPSDPGGVTNFGIALNSHPDLTRDDIINMTRNRAIGIYKSQYWGELYDQIESQPVADELFDFGVTSGPGTAVKVLQRSLMGLVAGPVVIDGKLGRLTLGMVNACDSKRLLREFVVQRIRFYAAIGKPEFEHSWFGRAIAVLL